MNADTLPSPLSAALARFGYIMGKLREAIGVLAYPPLTMQGGPVPPLNPDIAAIAWHRIHHAEKRFRAHVERFLAGKLPMGKLPMGKLRSSKPALAPREPRTQSKPESTPKSFLPRRFGWLMRLTVGMPARHNLAHAEQLRHLLAEPPVKAFLAASPRAGRILAPACHMLGIEKALLTPVGRISEAPSAVATLPNAEPATEPPPPPSGPGPFNPHLVVHWRPETTP